MDGVLKGLPEITRKETLPEIPKRILFQSRIFGKNQLCKYIDAYYQEESAERIPFYLPYIYMKEIYRCLCRYGGLYKKQVELVLIDDEDARTDYILYEFLEQVNYLTIISRRKAYFEGLQERAFQELGLLIDLVQPWEEMHLKGNLVWDLTSELQRADSYPENAICFVPHKKKWKQNEILKTSPKVTTIFIKELTNGQRVLSPAMAESVLVPQEFPFRKTRCDDLRKWCRSKHWMIKMQAQSLEKP